VMHGVSEAQISKGSTSSQLRWSVIMSKAPDSTFRFLASAKRETLFTYTIRTLCDMRILYRSTMMFLIIVEAMSPKDGRHRFKLPKGFVPCSIWWLLLLPSTTRKHGHERGPADHGGKSGPKPHQIHTRGIKYAACDKSEFVILLL
jgi:hypothetical protein